MRGSITAGLSKEDREQVELRDIEIFLVLAEELHFGRTAQRLHVSQARVSQAIKKQERRIGAELFTRTSRTVHLTEVGQPDFTVGPTLCTDSRILSVAADHQLAGRESVPLELLAEFPHGTALDLPDYWEDSYLPFHTPRGKPIERVLSGRGQSVRSVRHWARAVERSCGRSEDASSYCWSLTRSW